MGSIYEEIEIEDMSYDDNTQMYTYPCPCGDKFIISLEELHGGEDIAGCPSCTLRIKIIFDEDKLPELRDNSDEEEPDSIDKQIAVSDDVANSNMKSIKEDSCSVDLTVFTSQSSDTLQLSIEADAISSSIS